jgi:hypothetical protein
MTETQPVAQTVIPEGLDPKFRDKLTLEPGYNCPGFNLWDVEATDGNHYLMAADNAGSASTRLYFRTNGRLDVANAVLLGRNPDADLWCDYKGMSRD